MLGIIFIFVYIIGIISLWFFYKYLLSRLHWAGQILFTVIVLLYIYGKVPYAFTRNLSEILNTADKFVEISVDAEVNDARFKFKKVIKCSHDFSVRARDGITRQWNYVSRGYGVSNEAGQGLFFAMPLANTLCAPDEPVLYGIQSGELRRMVFLDNYESPQRIFQYDFLRPFNSSYRDYMYGLQRENIKINVRSRPVNSMKISFLSEEINEHSWVSPRGYLFHYQNKIDPKKSYYAVTVAVVAAENWKKYDQIRQIISSLPDKGIINISTRIKQSSMKRYEIPRLRLNEVFKTLTYVSDRKTWILNKNNMAKLRFYGVDFVKPNTNNPSAQTLWLNIPTTRNEEAVKKLYLNIQLDQNLIFEVDKDNNYFNQYYFWNPEKNEILIIGPNWKILQSKGKEND